jgi:hypothetical protein
MITGIHGMFYSDEAEALRAFIRDKLGIPARDVGGGWLIFDFAQADMGCHPLDHPEAPPSGTHNVSFTTDDLEKTVAVLRGRGVEFATEIQDRGYGYVIELEMPGGVQVDIYQKKY